jgi:hypothetical protein
MERSRKEEGFPHGEEGEVVRVALLDIRRVRLNEGPGNLLFDA